MSLQPWQRFVFGDRKPLKGSGTSLGLGIEVLSAERLVCAMKKFTDLQQVLIRSQAAVGERAIALASLETVQAEINRRRAGPRL